MKFLYKQNYVTKILGVGLMALILSIFAHKMNYIVTSVFEDSICLAFVLYSSTAIFA